MDCVGSCSWFSKINLSSPLILDPNILEALLAIIFIGVVMIMPAIQSYTSQMLPYSTQRDILEYGCDIKPAALSCHTESTSMRVSFQMLGLCVVSTLYSRAGTSSAISQKSRSSRTMLSQYCIISIQGLLWFPMMLEPGNSNLDFTTGNNVSQSQSLYNLTMTILRYLQATTMQSAAYINSLLSLRT